jgi:hypothetical protein
MLLKEAKRDSFQRLLRAWYPDLSSYDIQKIWDGMTEWQKNAGFNTWEKVIEESEFAN